MKKIISAVLLSATVGVVPLLAQEKKDMPMKGEMPMKQSMPMKGEGSQGGGMMMGDMNEMHKKMSDMKGAWAG
jgi:hypothetical protein